MKRYYNHAMEEALRGCKHEIFEFEMLHSWETEGERLKDIIAFLEEQLKITEQDYAEECEGLDALDEAEGGLREEYGEDEDGLYMSCEYENIRRDRIQLDANRRGDSLWIGVYKDEIEDYKQELHDATDVPTIVERIKSSEQWDDYDLANLCAAAGMIKEWDEADKSVEKSVVLRAAEKLGVNIQ